jgi:hypothetical protein
MANESITTLLQGTYVSIDTRRYDDATVETLVGKIIEIAPYRTLLVEHESATSHKLRDNIPFVGSVEAIVAMRDAHGKPIYENGAVTTLDKIWLETEDERDQLRWKGRFLI